MTTQERIAQLAQAALRSGPPVATPPKPVTFMPTFDLPAGQQPAAHGTDPAAAVAAAPAPALATMPAPETPEAPAAPVYKDTEDPELRALLDEKEAVTKKKLARQKRLVNFIILGLLGCGWGGYASSPDAQREVASLIPALKGSLNDIKTMATGTKAYDKSLEKIAVRGNQIDEATRAMGVDPNSVSKNEDPEMDKEMSEFMGGDGHTTGNRNKLLKDKFGLVSKIMGGKNGDAPAKPAPGAAPAGAPASK